MTSPDLNPYAPPADGASTVAASGVARVAARIVGRMLVVANGSALPPVCVKCGDVGAGLRTRSQAFTFSPPWASWLGGIGRLMTQKKTRFDLPICAPCDARWTRWNAIRVLGRLAPLGTFAIYFVTLALRPPTLASTDQATLVPPLFLLAWIGALAVERLRAKHVVIATRIDAEETWLLGVHASAMEAASAPTSLEPVRS